MEGERHRATPSAASPESSADAAPRNHGANGNQRRKRSAPRTANPVACTQCRQSKLRCERVDDGDCQRCRRLRLPCHKDSDFVRVSKSRRIVDLEEQVQRLSSILTPGDQTSTNAVSSLSGGTTAEQSAGNRAATYEQPPLALVTFPSDGFSSNQGSSSTAFGVPPLTPGQLSDPSYTGQVGSRGGLETSTAPVRQPALLSRSLSSIALTPTEIDSLFNLFFNNFHPFLPLLDPEKGPDQYYDDEPCLFWVIISIASRRYPEDVTLMGALSQPVLDMLWKIVASPPYTLWTVITLVMISAWPCPAMTMNHSKDITFSAISLSISRQVGVHRPKQAREFTRQRIVLDEEEILLRIKTWAAAHIVSQGIASTVGLLSPASFDWPIDLACELNNDYTLPSDLRFKLIIHRFCNSVDKVLDQQSLDDFEPSQSARLHAWISSWEAQLDGFEADVRPHLSAIDQIYLSWARLYVRAASLLDAIHTDERQRGVLAAYASSIVFLTSTTASPDRAALLRHAPASVPPMLILASWIILKVQRSSYIFSVGDPAPGRVAFNAGLAALRQCSVENNDNTGRASKMLGQLWHSDAFAKSVAGAPPVLKLRSRSVASVFYDGLATWREDIAGQAPPRSPPRSPSATMSAPSAAEWTAFFGTSTPFLGDFGLDLFGSGFLV